MIRKAESRRQRLDQEKEILFEFMHSMVEGVGEGVGREKLFQRIVHEAVRGTSAMSGAVFERVSGNQLRLIAMEGLFPPLVPIEGRTDPGQEEKRADLIEDVLRKEHYQFGEGLIGKVAHTGEALLVEDASLHPEIYRHGDESLEVTSLIIAPVFFRNRLLAVLAVANPSHGASFSKTGFSLVLSLAEQSGLALHNIELLAEQMERQKLEMDLALARSVQGMLLPKSFPGFEKLSISASYLPAQQVGGDMYNVFDLGNNRVGAGIADVSGKGISASLLMAIAQTNLRHLANGEVGAAEVLRRLNRLMRDDVREDMFITAVYAVIDLERESITLARAGHELPLIVSPAGREGRFEVQPIRSEGMALGMVPPEVFDAVVEEVTIPFPMESILLLYTDGVTEMVNPQGTEFSSERFMDLVLGLRKRSADQINEGILGALDRFRGRAEQPDDLTVLTVKRIG